ncbi:MAG: YebC/PmpR family DNA-binding transcriptional regulator [Campylobacter sp.]|nr:YebC/PmpR family DNA-binding transcriptional regulator [Campylobacter sp.]
MGRAFEYRRGAKEARWGRMSRIFPKLGKAITVAAKEGGPDPDMNPKLRLAIATAKAQNMPKNNIDAAISRATGKDSLDIQTIHYDARGPHGVMMIIECATDNNTRTVANIKSILGKNGAEFLPTGSLLYMFDLRAVFELKMPKQDLEEIELELIDYGLIGTEINESQEDDEESTLIVYGEYDSFGELNEGIEKLKLEAISGNLKYIAQNKIELSDEQLINIEKLIDKIEEDDDVQNIFTNIA